MENATSTNGNREYKDRLFNFIFGREENREWTLSLYNAINGSDHTDASLIEFNTLGDVLYMGMKNDTSFILSNRMSVYEHQSSYNPNMPVRMLDMWVSFIRAILQRIRLTSTDPRRSCSRYLNWSYSITEQPIKMMR